MFQLYTPVRLLVEPKDVVLILVSHSDSCFTIRLVDLWALYIFLFPYIQRVTYIAAIHQICAFCVRLCNVAIYAVVKINPRV